MTDPSFARQLITFTYPHIGNYGVERARRWSPTASGRARRSCARRSNTEDAPGAERGWLDWLGRLRHPGDHRRRHARARPPHPRARARCAAACSRSGSPRREARELIAAEPSMTGLDLAREVTPGADDRRTATATIADRRDRHRASRARSCATSSSAARRSSCTRARARADELLADDPDAIFLANGPGDPAALDYVVDTLRELVGQRPVFGICLGHQLLCRAVGLETFKLPVRPPRRQPPGQGPRDRPDRDHLAEPRLRGPRARTARGRVDADEPVRWETDFGAAAAQPREPLRPHGRGPRRCSTSPAARSSTTPRPGPGRTTRCTSSTASSTRSRPRPRCRDATTSTRS